MSDANTVGHDTARDAEQYRITQERFRGELGTFTVYKLQKQEELLFGLVQHWVTVSSTNSQVRGFEDTVGDWVDQHGCEMVRRRGTHY